jgi:DNA-binding response OmpR family regulator
MGNTENKRTVLVVEDDEEIAYILNFMLTREGFDVIVASHGKAAIEMVEPPAGKEAQPSPDLILLDIMLPYANGIEILGRIRASEAWKGVPVIMLTAKSQETNVVQALEAGANDYITKPFLPAEVLMRVKRFLK